MAYLHMLEQRGSPGLTAQVMPVFLKDTSTRLDALKDAVAAGQHRRISDCAHPSWQRGVGGRRVDGQHAAPT